MTTVQARSRGSWAYGRDPESPWHAKLTPAANSFCAETRPFIPQHGLP